jgi:predicted regulator of Ras-like GTPase activity (Roadblock/LC7/MglB family)
VTFQEILAKVIDGTPGALAGAIMGRDGIAIEEYLVVRDSVDLNAIAVEFERVLDQAEKVVGALFGRGSGGLQELVLTTGGMQILMRPVDEECFIVLALERTGGMGKARYLVASILHDLHEAL